MQDKQEAFERRKRKGRKVYRKGIGRRVKLK